MHLSDFDYELPEALIAQVPLADRTASRLLAVGAAGNRHLRFSDVLSLLQPSDVLVVNNTKVIPARLRGRKDTGGAAELLLERITGADEAWCQVRVSKAIGAGREVFVADQPLQVLGREGMFYRLRFPCPVLEFLHQHGEVPLPPYIDPGASDASHQARYQTVYAEQEGAVAAPTAGLHFTPELLDQVRAMGVTVVPVTLHVGAGTFQPVRTDNVDDHQMHTERFEVSPEAASTLSDARTQGRRIVAVGTTVVRTLEGCFAQHGELCAGFGETNIFLRPGASFHVVDALITNFHLPKSTLLMLVSAFAGYEPIMAAYAEAVRERYRFFSYGDAMWLDRQECL